MPYGSQDHDYSVPQECTTNGYTRVFSNIFPTSGSQRWIRSGANTIGIHQKMEKRNRTKPPLVWKFVRTNVKTGRKVWTFSKKLGHHVKVTEYLYTQKLVPDYSVFKKKKKAKKNPKKFTTPNPLNFEKVTIKYSGTEGTAGIYRKSNFSTWDAGGFILGMNYSDQRNWAGLINDGFNLQGYANFARSMPDYDSVLSEADSAALSKLYSKVKGQEVNIAQMLAESNQTISMINAGILRITKVIADLSRGRIRKAWKTLLPQNKNEAASIPLIIDFGIKPLMSDIEGLTKELWKTQQLTRVVKSVVQREYNGFVHNTDVVCNYGIFRAQTQVQVKAKLTVRYVATIEVQNKFVENAARLGLTNLGTVLWEKTPWSFVVDWFLPIGNYINNMDAFLGWKVVAVHRTVVYEQTAIGTRTISGVTSSDTISTGSAFQSFEAKSFSCQRVLMNDKIPPLPLPTPKNPVTLNRAVDALALFNQFLLRK